ncbi:MAG: 50S ribosomal protein L10 [Candidatus Paceibacterota bacterium]|jgi:large subunit ribosomal protein L10
MSRTKTQKKEILEKLEKIMGGAKSLVFVNIHGLKVESATPMRRQLTKDGVGFFVAKKTLSEKALEAKKYEGTMPALVGEFGMAYGTDLVAPARGVYEFQKKFKDQVTIIGGVFENKFMSKEDMLAIATIPPTQTLYGMFVNVINSPIQGFVVALSKIAEKKV